MCPSNSSTRHSLKKLRRCARGFVGEIAVCATVRVPGIPAVAPRNLGPEGGEQVVHGPGDHSVVVERHVAGYNCYPESNACHTNKNWVSLCGFSVL